MRLFFFLPIAALSACIASGTQVKEAQLHQLKKGESTYSDMVSALGSPNSSTVSSDGGRMACYIYVQANARPETFIPIVGAFVGGTDTKTNSTCLSFDKEGLLANYTSTGSQMGSGFGAESGTSLNERVPSEPRQSD